MSASRRESKGLKGRGTFEAVDPDVAAGRVALEADAAGVGAA